MKVVDIYKFIMNETYDVKLKITLFIIKFSQISIINYNLYVTFTFYILNLISIKK